MKEIRNLAEKKECFGEPGYEELTQEMKDRALLLLMFMVMKHTGELKSHGCARGDVQKLYTDKNKVLSPTPEFYSLKYVYGVIAKEGRDVVMIDLPSFFLQTKQENDNILSKLTGTLALLLVECNEKRWQKYIRTEDSK